MAKYKLNVTFEIESELQEVAVVFLKDLIDQHLNNADRTNTFLSLTRDGDRSGANLIAPINEKHYKHGKITLLEYLERNTNAKS